MNLELFPRSFPTHFIWIIHFFHLDILRIVFRFTKRGFYIHISYLHRETIFFEFRSLAQVRSRLWRNRECLGKRSDHNETREKTCKRKTTSQTSTIFRTLHVNHDFQMRFVADCFERFRVMIVFNVFFVRDRYFFEYFFDYVLRGCNKLYNEPRVVPSRILLQLGND